MNFNLNLNFKKFFILVLCFSLLFAAEKYSNAESATTASGSVENNLNLKGEMKSMNNSLNLYGYEQAEEAVKFIKSKIGDFQPLTAVVLGSGLGGVAEDGNDAIIINTSEIPNWPVSTAPGHSGRLIFKNVEGRNIVILQGRLHYYEGYTMQAVTFPTRVVCMLGIKEYIATNASGGIANWLKPGDIAAVADHINLMGDNPLIGFNDPRWKSERFPDMTHTYSTRLLDIMDRAAALAGVSLKRGVYIALSGPSYETPAEIRMARTLGADLVGMSTVPEIIVARSMGVETGVLSCVANKAAGLTDDELTGEEVLVQMSKTAASLSNIIRNLMRELNASK